MAFTNPMSWYRFHANPPKAFQEILKEEEEDKELQESLKPKNHSFSPCDDNNNVCFWCGESIDLHQIRSFINYITGERLVKKLVKKL